jgi:hypothetical protein
MKYSLFIDDERDPGASFLVWAGKNPVVITRTFQSTRDILNTLGCPIAISFDHDLGDKAGDGYDIAKKIVWDDMGERPWGSKFIPTGFRFTVHSQNPVGAKNIESYLNNYLAQFEKVE